MSRFQQLTFDPSGNNLFLHPRWGARTMQDIEYLDALHNAPKPAAPAWEVSPLDSCSTELAARLERCVDDFGCSGISF